MNPPNPPSLLPPPPCSPNPSHGRRFPKNNMRKKTETGACVDSGREAMRSSEIPSTPHHHPTPPPRNHWSLAGAGVRQGERYHLKKAKEQHRIQTGLLYRVGVETSPCGIRGSWMRCVEAGGEKRMGEEEEEGPGAGLWGSAPPLVELRERIFGSRCTSIKSQWDSETSFCSREHPSPRFSC